MTLGDKYSEFKKDDISLILHDECHNTSSAQCHKFLKHCKSINISVVGFSATPLRTGKNDKPLLLEIYGNKDDNIKLNLLTDYNMIYAISNKLILPPEFYWYKIESYNKEKQDDKNTEIVTQEELGSVLELLNHIIPQMPNKKIIAWCGTIKLAKKWKQLFEANYKQRKNMINFTFGLDTSDKDNSEDDYKKFKKSTGNCILFCANKHREGSDIKFLDACIFLDKVKERSSIPFIQSIGRVLRICSDTSGKISGIIIDGFVKDKNNYEKEFIHKIIGYYLALQNLTENNLIDIKLGKETIKINCNKLQWDDITKEFANVLQQKIKMSSEDVKKSDFLKLKENITNKNIKSKNEYVKYAKEHNLDLKPEIEYKDHGWINYYDFLDIDVNQFPKNKIAFLKQCLKYGITNEKDYNNKWKQYNLPSMPYELYYNLTNFNTELVTIKNDKKSTITIEKPSLISF